MFSRKQMLFHVSILFKNGDSNKKMALYGNDHVRRGLYTDQLWLML